MKKLCLFAAIISVLGFSSACTTTTQEPAPIDQCQTEIDNFDAALNVYSADQSNRNKCIAVKEAGTALLACPALTQSQKNTYKATIDAIYCN